MSVSASPIINAFTGGELSPHLDELPTRFQRMAVTHPRLHAYVMDRLGMRDVLAYLRREAASVVADRFAPEAQGPTCVWREETLALLEAPCTA